MKSLTVKDIFEWWRDLKSFAADIGQKYETVKKWRQRGRIPNEHWPALILAARAKGKKLTADSLLSMHVKRAEVLHSRPQRHDTGRVPG